MDEFIRSYALAIEANVVVLATVAGENWRTVPLLYGCVQLDCMGAYMVVHTIGLYGCIYGEKLDLRRDLGATRLAPATPEASATRVSSPPPSFSPSPLS